VTDAGTAAARRRPRPSWAEETPLDDLPSLADELLGPHEDDDPFDHPRDPRDRRGGDPR
jgi:dTMP kinase